MRQQAYLSLDRLRDDSRFASWLHGIVRNLCRTHLRDRQRDGISWESLDQEPGVIAPAALDPELVAQQREQQRQVLDAVHALSPAVQAGIPISIAEALMNAGAWDLADPVPVVERLLHTPDEPSLRRAAEEPFLVRVADAILEHLRLHVPTQGDSHSAELIIDAQYPPHHRPDSSPLVYMTYLYGGSFGGSNVPMPVSALPVLTARFKLLVGLDPGERDIAQQRNTPIKLKGKRYDLRVSTEPVSAPTPDPSTWGTLAPGYARLTLRLEERSAV